METKNKNDFKVFSSKEKTIYIPVPEFTYSTTSGCNKRDDNNFVGHKDLINRLKDRLVNSKSKTGAYLITGYRGMGKTSFVNEVIKKITIPPCEKMNSGFYFCYLAFVCLTFICVISDKLKLDSYVFTLIWIVLIAFVILCLIKLFSNRVPHVKVRNFIKIFEKKNLRNIFVNGEAKSKRLVIKLNLGHEVLNDRDILCLISKNIENKYNEYLADVNAHVTYSSIKVLFICLITGLLTYISKNYYLNLFSNIRKNSFMSDFLSGIDQKYNIVFIAFEFLVILGLVYYMVNYFIGKIIRFFNLSIVIPQIVKTDIKNLNERIESSIENEVCAEAVVSKVSFEKSRKKIYGLASVREIEQELINILEKISKSSFLTPDFIIVFDELDKINSEVQTNEQSYDELPEFDNSTSGFPGDGTSRKRKENILRMLGNMKYLVSTAKAKFIFISGRELYDASLADVSDREFAISSIFNDVIYIESFLSSMKEQKDITFMTEQFICMRLIPHKYIEKNKIKLLSDVSEDLYPTEYTLKTYLKYLNSPIYGKENDSIIKEEAEKNILFLYCFILYLTHISNGSPKKISSFFEKYIVTSIEKEKDLDQPIIEVKGGVKYYLKFDPDAQLEIGFVHYIAYPIVMAIINRSSEFGDKLLISASFLINHIYKYHNSGFSWRNMEYTPELLEVNRTPELRDFINYIISFLKQTHLSPIISGLYGFKFTQSISEEISMFSKLSEMVSASFNFTLDESMTVKRYYSKLLKYYSKNHEDNNKSHVIAGLHHILGDLHLADEEYSEAIFEYQESISSFSKELETLNKNDSHYTSHILSLTRSMLKLGLAFEKRKTYSSAYITYRELVSKLIEYRWFDESKLGLKHLLVKNKEYISKKSILTPLNEEDIKRLEKSDAEKIKKVQPTGFEKYESEYPTKYIEVEELAAAMGRQITPEKSVIMTKLSLFEDIRLSYQALLAKLFVLEKMELGGITQKNLDVVISEFKFMYKTSNIKDKYIIHADFYRKLGDVLFYKNGTDRKQHNRFFDSVRYWGYDVYKDISIYCQGGNQDCKKLIEFFERFEYNSSSNKAFILRKDVVTSILSVFKKGNKLSVKYLSIRDKIEDFIKSDFFCFPDKKIPYNKIDKCEKCRKELTSQKNRLPCHACLYYNKSVKILIKHLLNEEESNTDNNSSKSVILLRAVTNKKQIISMRENELALLASTSDNMANITICCSGSEEIISKSFIVYFLENIGKINTDRIKHNIDSNWPDYSGEFSFLEKSILYYWTAAETYKLSSKLNESSLCYKRILCLLVEYLSIQYEKRQRKNEAKKDEGVSSTDESINEIFNRLNDIKKYIANRAIQCLYSHYEHVNIAEIQSIKWILSTQMYDTMALNKLSLFPDIQEIVCLFLELKMKSAIYCNETDVIKKIYKITYRSSSFLIDRIDCTIYQQIVALRLKAIINRNILFEIMNLSAGQTEIFSENTFFKASFPIIFYNKLCDYLPNATEWTMNEEIKFAKKKDGKDVKNVKRKLDLLNFLVIDSMYCLSKIIGTIAPFTKTTLFSHSYIAGIYYQLFEWNHIYDFLYLLYKWVDIENGSSNIDKEKEKEKINKRFRSFMSQRSEALSDIEIREKLKLNNIIEIIGNINRIMKSDGNVNEKCNMSEVFFKEVMTNINKSNIHYTIINYQAEMAIKEYIKAEEMNNQGNAYKEMISNFYFLDDDLNNEAYKFNLAIERYRINSKYIDQRIYDLKGVYWNSTLYDVNNYTYTDHDNNGASALL